MAWCGCVRSVALLFCCIQRPAQLPVCFAVQVAPAQPPKLAADAEIGTKPEEADEEVGPGDKCSCWQLLE
jgi:hypothetical protein